MSSLLDDIEADHHRELLERGNLRPQKPAVSWSDENTWRSDGYEARILTTRCKCGKTDIRLNGVFHKKSTLSGKSKSQRLSDTALLQFSYESLSYAQDEATTGVCIACLPTYYRKVFP